MHMTYLAMKEQFTLVPGVSLTTLSTCGHTIDVQALILSLLTI